MFGFDRGKKDQYVSLAIVQRPDPSPHRFVSVWTDGQSMGMVLMKSEEGKLEPLADWKSRSSPMDFDFSGMIQRWHSEVKLSRIVANPIAQLPPEAHPMKGRGHGIDVVIARPMAVLEGMVALQDGLGAGRFDWGDYPSRGRVLEVLKRGGAEGDFAAMALLQGLARAPEFTTTSTETITDHRPTRGNGCPF